jgi:deoxyribonuclease-4
LWLGDFVAELSGKVSASITAIILAAGESRRMTRLKPLLPIGEESILEREIRMFREAGIEDIRVVAGCRAHKLIPVLERLSVTHLINPDYRNGMLSSIRTGVASLEDAIDAFFLLPSDIPLVRAETVRRLVRRFTEGGGKIIYPAFLGRRGHPPLISTELSTGILSYRGENGLRGFLATHASEAAELPVADRYILFDVDTPADYEKLKVEAARLHIPSEEECRVLRGEAFGTNAPVFRHALKVAEVSRSLATASEIPATPEKIDEDSALPLLGGHFSIAGGLHKALYAARDYGCNVLQVFTKNANAWKEREVTEKEIRSFDAARKETGIRLVFSHTSYLINPAAGASELRALSREALRRELVRSARLGIPFVVLHPGAHTGSGEAAGTGLIIEMLNEVFEATPGPMPRLLLETTAGQGSGIGRTFEQIARLIEGVTRKERVGVCFDTCHVFAAGYELRSEEGYAETMSSFLDVVGLERLFLIHLNDSKKGLGARVDRHAHIGEGAIGIAAFARIMNDARLANVPKIIETPKGKDGEDFDRMNLGRLRNVFKGSIDRISEGR